MSDAQMLERPKDPLEARLTQEMEKRERVSGASVRLREAGELLTGDAFIVPSHEKNLLGKLVAAKRHLRELHWRIYAVNLVLTCSLEGSVGPMDMKK